MSIQKTSPIGLYLHERGGLTSNAAEDAEPVDHFGYCPSCDSEVPVDGNGFCMHCFKEISQDQEAG